MGRILQSYILPVVLHQRSSFWERHGTVGCPWWNLQWSAQTSSWRECTYSCNLICIGSVTKCKRIFEYDARGGKVRWFLMHPWLGTCFRQRVGKGQFWKVKCRPVAQQWVIWFPMLVVSVRAFLVNFPLNAPDSGYCHHLFVWFTGNPTLSVRCSFFISVNLLSSFLNLPSVWPWGRFSWSCRNSPSIHRKLGGSQNPTRRNVISLGPTSIEINTSSMLPRGGIDST